jgi:hypothetical protein
MAGENTIKTENPVVETTGCKPKPTAYEKILEFIFTP